MKCEHALIERLHRLGFCGRDRRGSDAGSLDAQLLARRQVAGRRNVVGDALVSLLLRAAFLLSESAKGVKVSVKSLSARG